jgi:hypothetical protein
MLRNTVMLLCSLVLVDVLSSEIASARVGFRPPAWGWRGPAVGSVGVGFGLGVASGYYGYAYGYGDDYPSGYGEYAEYGPWASRSYYADCYLVRRRMWTPYGLRWRSVRACD